ncbi:hypothetical protein IC582_023868 [Cucumis melo]
MRNGNKIVWRNQTAYMVIWAEESLNYYFAYAFGKIQYKRGWGGLDHVIGLLNLREHWMVIAADMKKCKILVFDSMPNYIKQNIVDEALELVARWIPSLSRAIGLDLTIPNFKSGPWPVIRSKEALQHEKSLDCEIFCAKFIECFVINANASCLHVKTRNCSNNSMLQNFGRINSFGKLSVCFVYNMLLQFLFFNFT